MDAFDISIKELSLSYRVDNNFLLILDNLNISIKKEDIVVILGPSGCGKTTLLRLLSGLIDTTHNDIRIKGEINVNNHPPKANIKNGGTEYLFQNPVLLPWLDIKQNICLPLKIRSTPFKETDINTILETTGLLEYKKFFPSQLSGGMKQRVALARSFAGHYGLLLMDEPFGSLDERSREQMDLALIKYLKEWKSTVVFVTHNVREAALLGDKIIVMGDKPSKIVEVIEGIPKDDIPISDKTEQINDIIRRSRRVLGFSIY